MRGFSADAMRSLFSRTLDHAVRFRTQLPERTQTPPRGYADSVAAFAGPTPEQGEDPARTVDSLAALAEPGLMAAAGPRFFGWVMGGSHPVGVAADWLTAAWGQNGGNHHASPSAAAAETVAAGWLLDLLDLPREASVGFATGATVASFVCLAAARGEVLRRAGWNAEADGLFGAPPITVLIGDDAHTTIFSALQFLGLGHDRAIRIAADDQGRMRPEALDAAISGVTGPAILLLQAGQINTGAFDDFDALIPLARRIGAWVHVDGAFGLWARVSPAHRNLAAGVELADSWSTDGHKWPQIPFDSGFAIVRDAQAHERAMTISASYLPQSAGGERDPSHFVPELSRRARGFAAWAMIRHLGRVGLAEMVARHCAVARDTARLLTEDNSVACLNDVVLNQAIFRFGVDEPPERSDALTDAVIARVQRDGTCFVAGAKWRGRSVMRFSVTSSATDEAEGRRAAEAIRAAWQAVRPA